MNRARQHGLAFTGRWFLAVTAAISLLWLTSGCEQNNLQFYQNGKLVTAKNVSGTKNWQFDEAELGRLASLSLDAMEQELEMRYRNQDSTWKAQSEVYLFARDPLEVKATLTNILDDDAQWRDLVTVPKNLPMVAVTPFPPTAKFATNTFVRLKPVDAHLFWGDTPPSGYGAGPANKGSIKTVRVYQHGQCSTELPLQSLLEQFSTLFWQSFKQKVEEGKFSGISPGAKAGFKWLHATSYLSGDHSAGGGFFLNYHFTILLGQKDKLDNDLIVNYNYAFYLEDGILAISPNQNDYSVLGYGAGDRMKDILKVMDEGVPAIFYQHMTSKQMVPLPTEDSLAGDNPCQAAATFLAAMIKNGGKKQGFSDQEIDHLIKTALAKDGKDYRNIRYRPDGPKGLKCVYIVRAQRLNVFPDKVELIWLDDNNQENSNYPILVALSSDQAKKRDLKANLLCNRLPKKVDPTFPCYSSNFVTVLWPK